MRERLPKSYEKLNKLKHTKEWKEKVRKKIKDHYSDPANRKKQSDVMKRAYAKKMSVDSP